jgi:hypothetical protein
MGNTTVYYYDNTASNWVQYGETIDARGAMDVYPYNGFPYIHSFQYDGNGKWNYITVYDGQQI